MLLVVFCVDQRGRCKSEGHQRRRIVWPIQPIYNGMEGRSGIQSYASCCNSGLKGKVYVIHPGQWSDIMPRLQRAVHAGCVCNEIDYTPWQVSRSKGLRKTCFMDSTQPSGHLQPSPEHTARRYRTTLIRLDNLS